MADFDQLALAIARQFTPDSDPQQRAGLQTAIVRALKAATAAPRAGVAGHPIGERYRHFLNYGNLPDSPWLRYAYYHGADVGLDRPVGEFLGGSHG